MYYLFAVAYTLAAIVTLVFDPNLVVFVVESHSLRVVGDTSTQRNLVGMAKFLNATVVANHTSRNNS